MGKSEILVKAREQLLKAAKESQITEILFYLPINRDWEEEEEDLAHCMVNITVPPDDLHGHTRGDELRKFILAAEKCLKFKLTVSALDIEKEFLPYMCTDRRQQCEIMINAAIPLEQLNSEKTLLEQLQAKVECYKKQVASHKEVASEKSRLESTPKSKPTIISSECSSPIKPSVSSSFSPSFYATKSKSQIITKPPRSTINHHTNTLVDKPHKKRKHEPEKIEKRQIQKTEVDLTSHSQCTAKNQINTGDDNLVNIRI